MKKYIKTKMASMVMLSIMLVSTFTACSSDNDDIPDNGNDANAALIINGKNYGILPYGNFVDWADGTASFVFANQNMAEGSIDVNSAYTYVAVRIPYNSGPLPMGTFSGKDVDLDFDVNRILSTEECELTGWSEDLVMTVSISGEKYIVDVRTNSLHIYSNDEETGDGHSGTLTMHYEGNLSDVNNK